MTRKPPRNTDSDNDDSALFRQHVRGIRPRQYNTVFLRRSPAGARSPAPETGTPHSVHDYDDHPVDPLPEYVSFVNAGLQHKTMKRLQQGRIASESTLDLHGLTRRQAVRALELFLHQSQNLQRRCVTVIHGKGYRSMSGTAVLKSTIIAMLQRDSRIVAFCSAIPRDGGTGALYLLLKRATPTTR